MSLPSSVPPSQLSGSRQLEASGDVATRSINPRQCNALEGQTSTCQRTFRRTHKPSRVPNRYQRAEEADWLEERTWRVSPSGDSTGTGGRAPQREDLDDLSHDKSWESIEDAAVGSKLHPGYHIGRQIRVPTVTGQKLCEEPLDHHSR